MRAPPPRPQAISDRPVISAGDHPIPAFCDSPNKSPLGHSRNISSDSGKAPAGLGQDALLDFQVEVTLDGERLTAAEIRELLEKSDGLALVRGRWVEVDHERLRRMLDHFREIERTAAENGLGFREAVRLLAGADVVAGDGSADVRSEW